MKKRIRLILAIGCVLLSHSTFGQAQSLSGIREVPAPIPDIAIASFDQLGPIIYYNPQIVQRVGPAISAFMRAHEYGHHALGHLQRSLFVINPYTRILMAREAEIAADKFATEYWLRENPDVIHAVVEAFESPFTGNLGDITHLPTRDRAQLIKQWVAAATRLRDEGPQTITSAAEDISKEDDKIDWHTTPDNPTVDYSAEYKNTGTRRVRCEVVIAVGTVPRNSPMQERDEDWQGVSSQRHRFTLSEDESTKIRGRLQWVATRERMPGLLIPDPSMVEYPNQYQCIYTD
jgi:hypothetical protein